MSKALGLSLMLGALYFGMTLYTEGREQAFGGIFAPIQPFERGSLAASALSQSAQSAEAAGGSATRPRVKASDSLRERFSSKR